MSITALPTAPSRSDDPATFIARADAFLAALALFVTEVNATAAAFDVTKWVSGTTYAEGDTVWSPADFYTYRRRIAGGGTTDPSLDPTNWALAVSAPSPTTVGSIVGGIAKNGCLNGCCRVQAEGAKNLSTSAQYAKVDMWAGWASGGSVSAGSLTRDSAASFGSYESALHFSGITLTGSGVLSARQRIAAVDAAYWKNKTCVFSAKVLHDVGSAVNFTVVIRKPTASDNYAGVTVIGTSSAQSVSSGSATTVSYSVAMGDCSNGIEIEIQAAVGAITTRNLRIADMQLEEGATVTEFERRAFVEELGRCHYYFAKTFAQGTDPATGAGRADDFEVSGQAGAVLCGGQWWYPRPMRASPTITTYNPTNANANFYDWTNAADRTVTVASTTAKRTTLTFTSANGMTGIHITADARL